MSNQVVVWIIDDNKADRKILSILLEEMASFAEIRQFSSGSNLIDSLDKGEPNLANLRLLVFCDSRMGVESGEIVLSQIAMKTSPAHRYHVLMSGMMREEKEWKQSETIDDFMEKQSDLSDFRHELNRIYESVVAKFFQTS